MHRTVKPCKVVLVFLNLLANVFQVFLEFGGMGGGVSCSLLSCRSLCRTFSGQRFLLVR